jgi:hypothetical protein
MTRSLKWAKRQQHWVTDSVKRPSSPLQLKHDKLPSKRKHPTRMREQHTRKTLLNVTHTRSRASHSCLMDAWINLIARKSWDFLESRTVSRMTEYMTRIYVQHTTLSSLSSWIFDEERKETCFFVLLWRSASGLLEYSFYFDSMTSCSHFLIFPAFHTKILLETLKCTKFLSTDQDMQRCW